MAEADAGSNDRCKALTERGERCSRPAREDGFCHQHDESDPTVSETESAQTEEEQDEETEAEMREVDPSDVDTTDPEDVDAEDVEIDDERIAPIVAVRQTVQSTASDLIGRPFDGVSEISPTEDGWRAVVEVIERRSVPDTQDILGRYAIDLDEDGVILGYRRLDRYRRGDTVAYEPD